MYGWSSSTTKAMTVRPRVIRDSQARPYIVALNASLRKALQVFAIRHDGIDIAGRHSRRSRFCDVLLKIGELL
jgi:hypothetical protein